MSRAEDIAMEFLTRRGLLAVRRLATESVDAGTHHWVFDGGVPDLLGLVSLKNGTATRDAVVIIYPKVNMEGDRHIEVSESWLLHSDRPPGFGPVTSVGEEREDAEGTRTTPNP